jgi:hypothetical protein
VNEDPVNEDPVNEDPVNEDPVNEEQVNEDEEMLSPIYDDHTDEGVEQITRILDVIQIYSDSDSSDNNRDNNDSDASTQPLEYNYEDDFPDVQFQPARSEQPEQQEQPEQEQQEQRLEQQDQEQQDQEHQYQEDDQHCCAVCLDVTDSARNFVSLDCGHQFHFACIMSNMANGGSNRNQCPLCSDAVLREYDVHNLDEVHRIQVDEMVEQAASRNQHLQDELNLTRQHREDMTAEYVRVMSMNMQIGLRHHDERNARDALERRAYICSLNERIATVVMNAANNDIRQNGGAAMHTERQIRELCMTFGMMAYDAQYDEEEDQGQNQDQNHYMDDIVEVD